MIMYRVRTIFTGVAGSPWYSNMYFDSAAGTGAQAITAVDTFWQSMKSSITAQVTGGVLAEVPLIDSATDTRVGTFNGTPTVISCSSAGDPLPWATQALIGWKTGQYISGRELRGRTFIPGLTENTNSGGTVLGATVTSFQAIGSVLVGTSNADLVVYSPTHLAAAPATAAAATGKWSVLRSRRD